MKKAPLKLLMLFCALLNINNVNGQIITRIAGTGIAGYGGDGGPATDAKVRQFAGISVDQNNNIYIADIANHRVRKIDVTTGLINTIAGTGVAGYNGDDIPATDAQLNLPGLALFDSVGNIYIGDGGNYRIRKIDIATGIITTIAGDGTFVPSGDGGPATAATIYGGWMVFDVFGNLYVGDDHKIRKINTLGIITTVAGDGFAGITAEGVPATSTHIVPEGIGTDGLGNIYFADSTRAIRKITISTGIMTRVAGTGDGIAAPFTDGAVATNCHIGPLGIAVDNAGNIYMADHGNSRIERIDASTGIIKSIAGTGVVGYTGDDIPATSCELNESEGLAIDICGNVYIADEYNFMARKISYPPTLTTPSISLTGIPTTLMGSTVTVTATVANAGSSYLIHWQNHGIEFAATTVPTVTYTKLPGIDTITARVVPTGYGCWDSTTSAGYVVNVGGGDGVAEITNAGEGWCVVYPSPARDEVTIQTSPGPAYRQAGSPEEVICISNLMGQLFPFGKLTEKQGKATINISLLPPGMYMLQVTDGEGRKVRGKFIKE